MEKTIREVIAHMGLALVCVSLFFLFGAIGAIEIGYATFTDHMALIVSCLAVCFIGAVLTNVRKETEE